MPPTPDDETWPGVISRFVGVATWPGPLTPVDGSCEVELQLDAQGHTVFYRSIGGLGT